MKLTEKVALALASLRGSADFRVLMDFLKEDEQAELQRCVELDGFALHRAQGAVKKLQQLQVAYAEAPSVAEKIRNQRQTG